jgi:hypothetical protein
MKFVALPWMLALAGGAAMFGAIPAQAQDFLPGMGNVIYGEDNRIDVYAETDADRLNWAASTLGLVSASELFDNGNGTFSLLTDSFTYLGRTPCDGEPFANQPTAPYCSGFLAGEDVIVTAGHCMDNGRLATTRYVFGFQMLNADDAVTVVNEDQVYSGIEILGRRYDNDFDYTVVKLDRPVTAPGAMPLPIRRTGTVPVGTLVGVIGHPTGLPLKIAFGANTVVKSNGQEAYFMANLDTYGGNSGSPVFNASNGVVEGVLVRGERDYNTVGSCFESNRIPDSSPGEDISKSTTFADLVPEIPAEGGADALHSADTDGNNELDLSELLRIIQLYNADIFHCDNDAEDGFAVGTGDATCEHHDSDYVVVNFSISQSELLRAIQIYNSGEYTACEAGEDGFCV